ncbi:MAG: beta-ketoacyl synthase N-terminal-like domain-containing protein, partial [bacterium]
MKDLKNLERIAIIGIGAIMPGALNKDAFWKNIIEGRSSIIEVPQDRWDWRLYYDADRSAPDKTYSKIGGFIEGFKFDPIRHRIPPQVAAHMARLQHMAIEASVAALEDSGYHKKPFNREMVAVILGNAMGGMRKEETDLRVYKAYYNDILSRTKAFSAMSRDSSTALLQEVDEKISSSLSVITEDTMPGELSNVTAGRVASVLNLNGPNFTVDAACASSMAAMEQAANGLREGH